MAFDESIYDFYTLLLMQRRAEASGITTAASLLHALEENRQDVTHIHFLTWGEPTFDRGDRHTDYEDRALRLGEALANNTVVQFLDAGVDQLTMVGADALTPFIATSPSLSHVRLLSPNQPRQPVQRRLRCWMPLPRTEGYKGCIFLRRSTRFLWSVAFEDCEIHSLVKLELDTEPHNLANTPRWRSYYRGRRNDAGCRFARAQLPTRSSSVHL